MRTLVKIATALVISMGVANAASAQSKVHSVNGVTLGQHMNAGDRRLGCRPSDQWAGFWWCKSREQRTNSRGTFWFTRSFVLSRTGEVLYVNVEYEPAFWAPGEMQGELQRLMRKHRGEVPQLFNEPAVNGVMAVWGDLSLVP